MTEKKTCPRHGEYRADEPMCPDCSENLDHMNDDRLGVYPTKDDETTSTEGTNVCQRHGEYRSDERMCPHCHDTLAHMNDDRIGVYPAVDE